MKNTRNTGLLAVALLVTALAVGLSPAPAQAAGDTYAAIAYSTSTGRVGHGYGQPSRAAAEDTALANCGAGDAKVVVWVRNGWCALALGDDREAYGYGWDNSSKARAQTVALAECRRRTTNCYVHV